MFKRSIKTFIIGFIVLFVCILNVQAANLEELIEPGDIIIGNTVFRADDWISASRASKAGALYAMNTGETDVRVFYYDDMEEWYEYSDATSKYELVKEPTLSELSDIIDVYYDNNEPLVNTYESYAEYDDESVIMDANYVYMFFNNFYGDIFVNDEDVEIDYDNETITCSYGKVFDFEVVSNNETEKFKGICGTKEFTIETEEEYNYEKLEIESIELVNALEDENLINQEKVMLDYYTSNDHYSFADIYINEELEETLPSLAPISSTYVAVDIKLKGESKYELIHDINDAYVLLEGEDSIRLYLTADSYGFSDYTLTLLDYKYGTFEEVNIYFNGFERLQYDFTLENITNGTSTFDDEMQNNNDTIRSIDVHNTETDGNFISVNMVGELLNSGFNSYPTKWISLDLFFNEEVDYDYLNIEFNEYTDVELNYDYEILLDRVRLYFEYNEETFGYPVSITDERTDNSLYYMFVLNNYDEDKYIEADNGFEGVYITYYQNEIITKAPVNSSSHYDLYYDEEYSRLYCRNKYSSEILFKDATSLNLLTFNESGRPIIIDNVDTLEVYEYTNNNGEETYSYSSPYKLEEYPDLYDRVTNNAETYEFDIEKVIIYTFFKTDRVLTESEQAEFAKFDSLVDEGKVEIIDISDSVYEIE